ncbi:MAG: FAD-dependent oxidoreductase [Leptolyngbyaceae cyanobacterium bins.302]|nr:FAD-dependent oxidoreductase [Leptolyngbyaceae cyanobacterium bins.302]
MTQSFDALIIGAGQAGPPLAARLTAAGMRVALIERHLIGGTCVNTGCTPTKTLVASAYTAHLARRAADYGVLIAGEITVDMKRVKARADAVAANSRNGLETWLRSMEHLTVFQGQACFENENTLRVGDKRLTAPQIFGCIPVLQ